jgi:hypothetical protein
VDTSFKVNLTSLEGLIKAHEDAMPWIGILESMVIDVIPIL